MNKAVLTVMRLKKLMGFAISATVYVDNEEIGKLSPGNSVTKELEVGTHKVLIKTAEKGVEQEVNITETTNSVEISFKLKLGIIVGVPKIVDVKYN